MNIQERALEPVRASTVQIDRVAVVLDIGRTYHGPYWLTHAGWIDLATAELVDIAPDAMVVEQTIGIHVDPLYGHRRVPRPQCANLRTSQLPPRTLGSSTPSPEAPGAGAPTSRKRRDARPIGAKRERTSIGTLLDDHCGTVALPRDEWVGVLGRNDARGLHLILGRVCRELGYALEKTDDGWRVTDPNYGQVEVAPVAPSEPADPAPHLSAVEKALAEEDDVGEPVRPPAPRRGSTPMGARRRR